eukprot:178279-Chlamydomonas_euryale.AAC.2
MRPLPPYEYGGEDVHAGSYICGGWNAGAGWRRVWRQDVCVGGHMCGGEYVGAGDDMCGGEYMRGARALMWRCGHVWGCATDGMQARARHGPS